MPERRSCLVWLGGVQCLNHLVLVKEVQTTQDRDNFSRCGLMEVSNDFMSEIRHEGRSQVLTQSAAN